MRTNIFCPSFAAPTTTAVRPPQDFNAPDVVDSSAVAPDFQGAASPALCLHSTGRLAGLLLRVLRFNAAAAVLVAALALSACASPQWESIMANRQAKGAYQDGQCATYAKDLQQKVPFPTKLITWTATDNAPHPHSVRHQVLAYEVGTESWFIDNVTAMPRWVGSTTTPVETRAKQFYAPYTVAIEAVAIN